MSLIVVKEMFCNVLSHRSVQIQEDTHLALLQPLAHITLKVKFKKYKLL